MHQLPAGLLDQNIEFFTDHQSKAVYALHNSQVNGFDTFPEWVKLLVWYQIKNNQPRLRALIYMAGPDRDRIIKQYILCQHGGFDNHPDIAAGELQEPEYWSCPYRGQCRHEGTVCDKLRTPTGAYLTKREIQVLRLVANGALDKEIAGQLDISVNTVTMHTKNLRIKTGLFRKADLTRFATLKNLI